MTSKYFVTPFSFPKKCCIMTDKENEVQRMDERFEILPNVFLRAVRSEKFKTGCFSVNLIRPLCSEEAAKNALLPSVLLRGTKHYPNINAITNRMDELYGSTVGAIVRKRGEVQAFGFFADFLEDAFAPDGTKILAAMTEFLHEALLEPLLENGCFCADAVEGEKQNLIHAVEAALNDKRTYAAQRLNEHMCAGERYSVPRLGTVAEISRITPQSLFDWYGHVLRHSRVEIFYLGRAEAETVCALFRAALSSLPRGDVAEAETVYAEPEREVQTFTETMDVQQAKLAMGFRTGCTVEDADYPALLMANTVLGGGVSSKLFANVREKLSLCYYAGSALEKYKGLMVISSGIETENYEVARQEILRQLADCCAGAITDEELENARSLLLSSWRAALDSPGRIEDYYMGQAMSRDTRTIDALMQALSAVTREQTAAAARRLRPDTVFFLKGAPE